MPQFKNTADLMAYLKKAVDESLTNDVFPIIRDEEVEAIKDIVYSMDTSGYYQRRYDFGGIGDPYNIVIKGYTAMLMEHFLLLTLKKEQQAKRYFIGHQYYRSKPISERSKRR